eukprot:9486823-Pyramimonas_sp.AAC.1
MSEARGRNMSNDEQHHNENMQGMARMQQQRRRTKHNKTINLTSEEEVNTPTEAWPLPTSQ